MKTRYVLLKLKPQVDDLFLVVAEPASFEHECDGGCDDCREYYEDKFCSPELLKTAQTFAMPGEDDPHHLFEFVALVEAEGKQKPSEMFREVLGEALDDVDVESWNGS